jgi:uncharacterized protein (TIGR03437 family)
MKLICSLIFVGASLAGQSALPTINSMFNFGAGTKFSPSAYAFVYGTNFGTSPKAFVGTTPAQLFQISDTYFSMQIPASVPAGPATLTVQTTAGTSAAYRFTLDPTSPVILFNTVSPPFAYFFDLTSTFIPYPTPSPGDRLYLYVDGVGPTRPPVAPQILIDGNNVPVLSATTFNAYIGGAVAGPVPAFQLVIPALAGGPHTMIAVAGNATSPAVQFTIINRGLFTSQTGLTFNAVQGGPAIPSQSFSVLSGSGTINFSITTSTVSGGSWLSAAPTGGTSTVATGGAPIQVTTNPSGLAVGTYYGTVSIASPDVPNSPQAVTVVLNVSTKAGPSISKTGLIFLAATGGANPAAQTITAFDPAGTNVSFTTSLQGANGGLFSGSPTSGTIAPGQTQSIKIQPASTNLAAGTYAAKLVITFSDGTVRTVNLLLVVAQGASSISVPFRRANSSCAPTKLLPVFTQVGDNFAVPAAWPTDVEATIVDDCGNAMNTGNVVVSFSNGDSPLRLDPILGGVWTSTWPPSNPRGSVTLTLNASQTDTKLFGSAQVTGGVNANPAVPQVAQGGVVETAAYAAPVAPGNLVAIFGVELSATAQSATAVPLPNQLLTTSVLIDGQFLPMYYTSGGQINAVIPYGLQTNARHQVVVQRGSSLSVPQSVLVGVARPGVFTIDASGTGQGHIYKVDSAGNQIRADVNAPAKPGDTLVIYCSGLGAVNPPLTAGTPPPLTFLTKTVDTLTATIGGKTAQVNFAGLTPGSTALYQVNVVVPAGLPNNSTTTLQLSISGQDSNTVTFAVQQ